MTLPTLPRIAIGLVVVVALSLSLPAVAQTVTKKKTHTIVIQYSLAPGASTGLLGPLPKNIPVIVTANCSTLGDIGVGQVVVQNVPGEALEWAGNSTLEGAINQLSGTSGDKIMSIDQQGYLQLQVQQDSDTSAGFGFIIKSTGGETFTGEVRVTE